MSLTSHTDAFIPVEISELALDPAVSVRSLTIEQTAAMRLFLDPWYSLVEKRRKAAGERLAEHIAEHGPLVACGKVFGLKRPGSTSEFAPVEEVLTRLYNAGIPKDQVFKCLRIDPAELQALAKVYDLEFDDLKIVHYHKPALQIS